MSIIDTLITDRTPSHVERAKYLDTVRFQDMTTAEQAEYLQPLKGKYGASDLQRVEQALVYVADRLKSAGYAPQAVPETDWEHASNLPPGLAARYLECLSNLRRQFVQMSNTPDVPADMESFTYQEANNIEKILLDIDTLLTGIEQSWFYSGDVYSGEV